MLFERLKNDNISVQGINKEQLKYINLFKNDDSLSPKKIKN